ncbi:Putative enterochelin esterase [Corynebacterium glyciniphilum AJ 3170]|uniref:Putative enterochelin esterase n=1 Tax=Corynebacterium glyciniphilum AJ 3170 TaxID=1404245 RepID=X5E9Y3_9CORY|nr:alpha/beta hydrolase-fold protein [Corynebacterium glyciniphilum]AHW63456.1 Putative enterochelin esterase [Corynebacterium glyciniphilum AJ 3170]
MDLTFSYPGRAEHVFLHIDGMHDHHTPDLHRMTPDGGGWTSTLSVPDDLVSSYRVVPLDASAAARFDTTADPRSRWLGLMDSVVPHVLDHPAWYPPMPGSGASGRLIMPGAPEQPGWAEDDPVTWDEAELDGRRLWTSGLRDAECLLVISDGVTWAQTSLPAALERLRASGRLPRLAVVAVDTRADRVTLLSRSEAYRTLISDRVLPWARTLVDVPPGRTVIAGESLGGLSAVDLVLRRPDAVQLAVATSGSFWFDDVASEVRASGAPSGVRVHLSAGRGEGRNMPDHAAAVADALRGAGVPTSLDIGTHGHEMAGWTGALTRGLVELLRRSTR